MHFPELIKECLNATHTVQCLLLLKRIRTVDWIYEHKPN